MDDYSVKKLHRSGQSKGSSASSYKTVASEEIELTDYSAIPPPKVSSSQTRVLSHVYRSFLGVQVFWKKTVFDIKNAPWEWMFRRAISQVLPVFAIAGLTTLLITMSLLRFVTSNFSDLCQPDGTFSLSWEDYSPWKRDAIFAINMGYGNYSFGVAKLIDVVWDVAVGRGGQVFLAFFSYKVFTKVLAYRMETSYVSHETFRALTLENDTFWGLSRLIKHFNTNTGISARVTMFWVILAAFFVLLIPTWLSAMTGYSAVIIGFIRDSNDNLISAGEFLPTMYVIHDGERLGLPYTNDYHVTVPWRYGVQLQADSYGCEYAYRYNYTTEDYYWVDIDNENCALMWRLSEYAYKYGLLGRNNTETQFVLPNRTVINLDPPSLNFSGHFVQIPGTEPYPDSWTDDPWFYIPYGRAWKDPVTNTFPFQANDPLFYYDVTKTGYNQTGFNANGSCLQESDVRYKWGFSFLLLFAFIVTLLIWVIVMYALYLDAYLHSRLDRLSRHMGTERAIIDLSVVMQKKLDADEVEMYSNSQLERLVRGDNITYTDLVVNASLPTRWQLVKIWWKNFKFIPWMKAEKWWLLALLVFTILFGLSFMNNRLRIYWSVIVSVLPGMGVFLVLIVGRGANSRWLIFASFFIAFLAVDIYSIIRYSGSYYY